jgi:hypothetical protein
MQRWHAARAQGRPVVNLVEAYDVPLVPENDPFRTWLSISNRVRWAAGLGGPLGVGIAATDGHLAAPIDCLTITTDAVPIPGVKFKLAGCLPNPDSRATVRIGSKDPFESPDVNTNFLGTNSDMARVSACLMRQRNISSYWPKSFGRKEVLPGLFGLADAFGAPDAKQVKSAIRNVRSPRSHAFASDDSACLHAIRFA